MNLQDNNRKIFESTQQWLQRVHSAESITPEETEQLRNLLRFHENRYYVQNNPLISDGEYDALFTLLTNVEKLHPERVTADSPSQRVGVALIKDFPKVAHLVPMLSLQNSYNIEELREWDRRVRELGNAEQVEYCVEPKFDGASISLIYAGDRLERGSTRGDGTTGDEITPNIKRIRTVPLHALFSQYGIQQVEIRGEVLMSKKAFNAYNEKLMEAGEEPLANPRNAAAGTLRMKDPEVVAKRNLEAFVYQISFLQFDKGGGVHPKLQTHSGNLELLWEAGFRSPVHEMKVVQGIESVMQCIAAFEAERDSLPYEIDGMVVKVNNLAMQEKLGMTSHHPRWAIAYKFKARQATSVLQEVTFQVGRTGAVTPVAKIKPVQVGGVTISSISIHNQEYIKEKDLKIGDTILIERSGDVIPQIVKSFPELRTGSEREIEFPHVCPVCGDALFKTEDEAVWRCVNANCKAQVVESIIHFAGKDTMDIRNLGEQIVRRLFELNLLTSIPGIYTLNYDAVRQLEGMGDKSVAKLKEAIEASKQRPLHRLIYALGIRYVGETTAKTLARHVNRLQELAEMDEAALMQLEDVGVKVAGSIVHFFQNKDNIRMIEELEASGVSMDVKEQQAVGQGSLAGKTFLFTGTLSQMKRSEAEAMVEKQGGSILNSVSSKLNYLVVGADAGSKLEKAKKMNTIRILSESDFLNLFNI
jgi:DNA ligase (NAD+)